MNQVQSEAPRKRGWTFGKFVFTLFLYLWAALFLVIVGLGVLGFVIYDHITQPGVPGPEVEVAIPAGATGQRAGEILQEQGMLYHPSFFTWAMKLDETHRPIIRGKYRLARGLSPMELLHLLQEGPAFRPEDQIKITVPEGLTIQQTAALFDQPDAFIAATTDPVLIQSLGIQASSLEGFLMPNTYYFDRPPTEKQVVQRMVEQFIKEYTLLEATLPGAKGQDKLQVVTLASLIEEEAKVEAERPLVAAVLRNRLNERMPLQMDSTLQFALNKYGQRLLDEDKRVDSPYNSYQYPGLPPGPISSPGIASLRAALQPADADYLYFVSNADGTTHTFSSTFQEHERAVAKFRREIAPQRRQLREMATPDRRSR